MRIHPNSATQKALVRSKSRRVIVLAYPSLFRERACMTHATMPLFESSSPVIGAMGRERKPAEKILLVMCMGWATSQVDRFPTPSTGRRASQA